VNARGVVNATRGAAAEGVARLAARPIAHRGLHDAARGLIENMPASIAAAIAGNYGIEVDLQISADAEAMVHHDDRLGRLASGDAALADLTAAALKAVAFHATAERMMTLGDLCDLVAGRVPMMIELKSRFDGDLRVASRAAAVLAGYRGPIGVASFDPALIGELQRMAPALARGIIAERQYDNGEWQRLGPLRRLELAFLLHGWQSRPDFVAYRVRDLTAVAPRAARHMFGLPLLTWTVRSDADRAVAARFADQIIFEGFRP
jgi:glycerophosphoryl diester phosphodiesterase